MKPMFTLIIAIAVIGVIIFVHELGHFLVAKAFGIGVERFSIGYPPSIFRRRIGDTEYCIGSVPFGGYVKLVGELPEEGDFHPRSFRRKPPAVRAAVLAAGPAMNIATGLLLLWAVLTFYGEGTPCYDEPRVGSVVPGMPAAKAGLRAGDLIAYIDGDTVENWDQMANIIHSKPGVQVELVVVRGDSVFEVACTPELRELAAGSGDTAVGVIGIVPYTKQHRLPPARAFVEAWRATLRIAAAVTVFVVKLVVGKASISDIGGPVMIAQMAGQTAKLGFWQLLAFIAALSVNLAVLNLFPLPILDGGQIVLTAVEALRRKAISARLLAAFQQASIIVLLALMLFVTIKDIARLF